MKAKVLLALPRRPPPVEVEHDYTAKLEEARKLLREKNLADSIDPRPPTKLFDRNDESRVLMRGRCRHHEWVLLCRICTP